MIQRTLRTRVISTATMGAKTERLPFTVGMPRVRHFILPRVISKRPCRTLLLALIGSVLIACEQQAPGYQIVTEAEITAGDTVPVPTESTIITVSGDISVTNVGDSLVFDMRTLERLGIVQYSVPDPWLNEEVTYAGVLLADLLKVAGVSDAATSIRVVSLDGYVFDTPVAETEAWPVLLATRANDQYMDIANSGPTRIIFPYDSYPDLSAARNMSVWNIREIQIR